MALKKLVAQIEISLFDDLEKYAKDMHLNRTAAVSVLLTNSLKAEKGMATLSELLKVYNEQKDNLPRM